MYKIKLEEFEGPMDLLLSMITESKIDIYNIPISKITTQYIEYLKVIQDKDMNLASEFLVMAATLIEIKSRMLLPDSALEALSAELDGNDPRTELILKLIEFKKFKEASKFLGTRLEGLDSLFYKEQEDLTSFNTSIPIEELNSGLDQELLMEAMKRVLKNLDMKDKNREGFFTDLKRDEFTVDEKIDFIRFNLQSREKFSFMELFGSKTNKFEIITTFLAVLELLKLKIITIKQDLIFDEILIIKKDNEVKYGLV